jgi:hypothetical protein
MINPFYLINQEVLSFLSQKLYLDYKDVIKASVSDNIRSLYRMTARTTSNGQR